MSTMSAHKHARNNVTAAIRTVRKGGPELNLRRATACAGNKFARITGTILATASATDIAAAVRKLNGKLSPIEGTFVTVASDGTTKTIEGVVGLLQERIVLSDENRAQFESIASNMYLDSEERLWSAKKTDAGEILIKSHAGDDLEVMKGLMQCVASSTTWERETSVATANLGTARNEVEGGDLITYVNHDGRVTMGFALASVYETEESTASVLLVVDRENDMEQIDRNLVVACVKAADIEADETAEFEAVAAGSLSIERIREYYRKMFIRRPEYFEKFWARFTSHVR